MCLRDFFELQRKIVGCVCCILFGGPVMIVIGIIILAGAGQKTRENAISSYNTAVSTWTNTGYTAWNGYTNGNLFALNGVAGFQGSSISNNPAVESGDGISTYTNTWGYRPTAGTLSAAVAAFSTMWSQSSTATISLGLPTGSVYTQTGVPLGLRYQIYSYCSGSSSSDYSRCQSSCAGTYGGNYQSGGNTCTVYYTLSQICLVVNPQTNQADMSWNSNPGCFPLASSNVAGSYKIPSGAWSMVFGSSGVGPYGYSASASPPSVSINWASQLQVTVRSSQDPWVNALRSTEGTPSSFGLSVGAKIGLGVGLIAAGLLWTLAVFGAIYCLVKGHRKRRAIGGTVVGSPGGQAYMQQTSVPVATVVYPGQQMPMAGGYPQQPPMAPMMPPQQYGGYPPQQYGGYPPQQYGGQSQQPYGYPSPQAPQQPMMATTIASNNAPPGVYPYPKSV